MKATLLHNTNDDLFIANTARVSFGRWNEVLDLSLNQKGKPKDPALIEYLAKHKHQSPFYHVRFTFSFLASNFNFNVIKDPSILMNASYKFVNDNEVIIVRTSVYGWLNLINNDVITDIHDVSKIYQTLALNVPYTMIAYGLMDLGQNTEDYLDYSQNEVDPLFIDASVRIEAPIPIARQAFTHREFVSNEVSRRYVSDEPLIYIPEAYRAKPEGSIKQGSGDNLTGVEEHMTSALYESTVNSSKHNYTKTLSYGLAPEQARFMLPQAMETQFIFTGSLYAWAKLIVNRTDSHAQLEIQDLANSIHKQLYKTHGSIYMDGYTKAISAWESEFSKNKFKG